MGSYFVETTEAETVARQVLTLGFLCLEMFLSLWTHPLEELESIEGRKVILNQM